MAGRPDPVDFTQNPRRLVFRRHERSLNFWGGAVQGGRSQLAGQRTRERTRRTRQPVRSDSASRECSETPQPPASASSLSGVGDRSRHPVVLRAELVGSLWYHARQKHDCATTVPRWNTGGQGKRSGRAAMFHGADICRSLRERDVPNAHIVRRSRTHDSAQSQYHHTEKSILNHVRVCPTGEVRLWRSGIGSL
jgi:hypothetical protein